MTRKFEEAQSKLEENEAARKRLQGRLESLSRQMEEGQGDRERLVEQLENLRGQVRESFATLVTRRKLGRVNFRKDVWDCFWGQRK